MGSRLAELQTRYKQKQLQEMETKLKKLLPNTDQKTFSVHITKTTVMEKKPLEERKQKAGIDRSYPLKPLKVATTRTTQNIPNTRTISMKAPVSKSNLTVARKTIKNENENLITDDVKAGIPSGDGSINGFGLEKKLMALEISDNVDEQHISNKTSFSQTVLNKSLKGVKQKPQLSYRLSMSNTQKQSKLDARSHVLTMRGGAKNQTSVQRAPVANRPSAKQNPRGPSSVTRDDLASCKFCNRRFAPERLQIHEDICGKTGKKKRKTYDAMKHRVQGTELEPFVKKGGRASSRPRTPSAKRSNWRQTHNEFISAIRTAKMTQAHIAKGGKLSDLPPPPPSSNPDYVQCPHCGRKFNQAAAERHIPKCATYEFNKPRGAVSSKKPTRR